MYHHGNSYTTTFCLSSSGYPTADVNCSLHCPTIQSLGCETRASQTALCQVAYTHTDMCNGAVNLRQVCTVFPWFLPAGTINFSACQDAGTIREQEQNKSRVNITWQSMQSIVLTHVWFPTTRGPCCCQQWAQLSQSRSLLRQLPPLQALQCTTPSSMPRCEYFCTWSSTHLVWISLLCGHYLRAELILLSSTRTRSAGSIRGREEIEEIWVYSVPYSSGTHRFTGI